MIEGIFAAVLTAANTVLLFRLRTEMITTRNAIRKEVNEMSKKLEELVAQVETLTSEIAGLKADVAAETDQVTAAIQKLEAAVGAEPDTSELSSKITSAIAEIRESRDRIRGIIADKRPETPAEGGSSGSGTELPPEQ